MGSASALTSLGIDGLQTGAAGRDWLPTPGAVMEVKSPIDGRTIAAVRRACRADVEQVVSEARSAFELWRARPAPARGRLVREIGQRFRDHKEALAQLITLEMGKVIHEARGEVQEMIDMADLAVGLSRQLYGKSMHSERPGHRMYEQWHPLGPIGVITAFNFPASVWSWNALVAAVAGDAVVWKPSSKTPLTAIAIHRLVAPVAAAHGVPGLFGLVIGSGSRVGEALVADERLPLISATGSVPMGRRIGQVVAGRLGRSLLELGGNNGLVVLPDADLDLATRAILFGAVGTAGQRCTTIRRLIVQRDVAAQLTDRLIQAYRRLPIGDPREERFLMGPLVDGQAVTDMQAAIETATGQGGHLLHGGQRLAGGGIETDAWVQPAIVKANADMPIVGQETFAPILYAIEVDDLEEAIAVHNAVPQGLSSGIFTESLSAAERFLSTTGSDCGIVNVNAGTSGAEIGGAFGGEKETGGGREAGSDAWKAYMRRQTVTINHSGQLPLAQGVDFDV